QPGGSEYNIATALRLAGELEVPALAAALAEVVRRHEALRTVFREAEGAPVQVIQPFDGFALPVDALPGGDEGARAVRERIADEAVRPFDLAAGPLFRARLLRVGAEDHVLLLCMHHVVSDGWSMDVLFRELSALYAAHGGGGEAELPPLPVQYADYAAWQREQLRGEVLDRQLAYWRERLAGAPALLELPADHARPAVQGTEGASVSVDLPPELLQRLLLLGRGQGATLFMVLLGAFQVLLAKYSGSEDVVVGSPAAGRARPEVEGLIGFFVNTLVLRTDLSGDPAFRQVLRRVREAALGAYEHQELPFERLVAELQPERSLGHSPLFQVLFALQNDDLSGGELPGLRTEPFGAAFEAAKFDLTLMFGEHAGGLWGEMTYRTDLWERPTVERMLRHLRRVLEQVSADPDLRLSGLQLLDDGERRQLLESWSGTDAPYPSNACIHQLFQAQAARTADAVAIVHETESITYSELNARANRLAHHLRRLGVGPETRVGICLPRGVEMVAALLGVLKARGAYVPLDPAYPPERLAFMLADSGAAVLVTKDALRGVLPVRDNVRIVLVDRDVEEIAGESADDPAGGADARGLAYLIYTSGSTGVPKGVAIEHQSAVAMLAWAADVWSADDLSGMLASTSICFDLSVYELFLPLTRGGRVIIVENALALAHSAAADQVRLINTVPSAIAALLRDDAIPAGVRTVNLAGELLRQELVDALYARPGIDRVYDLYGPSEDTTYSTFARRTPGGTPSIGRTISNTRGYIVDAGLRLVLPGVAGELCLAGKGLARGYLGRPALTAERFIPDPFSATAGARMYRTGDRVRWREESAEVRECVSAEVGAGSDDSRTDALTHSRTSSLEYLGRLDQQVKVRGFRIEPGEIEAVLRRLPGVADCAVVARADDAGERRLVAYVVGDAQPEQMRAHLRRTLPEYMVPGAFVRLDALPLTPSGKVDRKALPAPDAVSADDQPAEARTPLKEVLAGIWAGVLKTDRVGPDDNFFQLGGHSLLATVVVARVQEVLGVRLPLSALFTAPTVSALAAEVETLRRAGLPPLPPVAPVDRGGSLPLSFAQERLWFLDRLQPESAFYNVPMALWLDGALDVRALEHALGEIVRRHEVLRTTFRERDGAPSLSIAPFEGWTLPVDDLYGAGEAEAERRAAEEAARPFDLGAGPLFRARLLRLDPDAHVLLMTLHHTVSDEWSFGVLFRELSALYAAALEGAESPLADLPVQYADYAVWQREQLAGEMLDRQLAYWKKRLTGAPALLELPIDHPRPTLQSYRGARESFDLPADLLARLESLGRGEGATLFMVMLGALQVLLAKYSGSDDVVVGSPITGRTRHEVEGLIGFFTNTLVLRTDLSGDPGFRDVLRRVREATLGAYDHQDVPFERLVEELQPERSLGHSPLFQVMLIQGSGDDSALTLPGIVPRAFGAGTDTAKFDLTLAVTAHADGIAGSIEYSTDLFEPGTVLRMIGHLERVLEQVSVDPDLRLSRLELLGDEERRLVVEEWNGTDTPYPSTGACVHHLIEAQAARTPEAVAVLHGAESLTYRQLNERANRLAHRLMEMGVGPEARVGICLERGTALVAAVLAVLKAGGAYVPMDPAYPAPRLAF
ncbi:MAG TPA: amino acid adenylation domain-containing protein, partial [Longimicrobium sp.]|nr:amino acid adenylation domain-containing protein [Longimicrobium sp.]